MQPASNALKKTANAPEKFYPLRAVYCGDCFLMQVDTDLPPTDMFNSEYAYFSGQSAQWQKHCEDYVDMIIRRRGLNGESVVLEIGGNDGTLLKHFGRWAVGKQFAGRVARAINFEPCDSVAEASEAY